MRKGLYSLLAAFVGLSAAGWAQEATAPAAAPAKLDITAEQVIEKSIQALGGPKAFENLKSNYMKATLELAAMGVTADLEIWAKAPNKQLTVTTVEGFGEVKQGFDGQTAWADNPMSGLVVLEGEAAAVVRRESTFNRELKWRELYTKAEVKGKEKVEDRDAYVVELTPAEGKPVTRYYDVETFQLIRADMHQPTMQGVNLVQTVFGDYREVEGRKVPFLIKQTLPEGEIVVKVAEVKPNVEIDDARFAKPEPPPAPEQK